MTAMKNMPTLVCEHDALLKYVYILLMQVGTHFVLFAIIFMSLA